MESVLGGPQHLAGGFRVGRLTEDVLASDAHRAEAEPPMSELWRASGEAVKRVR